MRNIVNKYLLITLISASTLTACPDDKGGRSSSDEAADTEDFITRLAQGLCQWYSSCGRGPGPDDFEECVTELTMEITAEASLDGQLCHAFISYYTENQQALDACLQTPTTQCDNDDITTFCPVLGNLEVDGLCDEELNARNNDDDTATNTSTNDDDHFVPDVRSMIVGGWLGRWSCETSENQAQGEMFWTLCPNGKLSGFTKTETSRLTVESVASGSYTMNANDSVSVSLVETVVNPSIVRGDVSTTDLSVVYSSEDDALRVQNYCGFWMVRLEGGGHDEINNSDCEPSATGVGGGDDACGTDCDCGRCWYCERGTCRYGGEGPYGCYRGCQ